MGFDKYVVMKRTRRKFKALVRDRAFLARGSKFLNDCLKEYNYF